MADIIAEINTIGDVLGGIGATRFYKQDLPTKYVANTICIRWQGDGDEEFTQAAYAVERVYQIIYFGKNEVSCLQNAEKIRKEINGRIKVKLRGLDGYMTLGSFNFAPPFKTDTDGVYAVSGVLLAKVYIERPRETWQKIGKLGVEVTPHDNAGNPLVDEIYEITTNEGAI